MSDSRKLGCALLTCAMRIDPNVRFESYDRLFLARTPRRPAASATRLPLPFQGDARRDGNPRFSSMQSFRPYADPVEVPLVGRAYDAGRSSFDYGRAGSVSAPRRSEDADASSASELPGCGATGVQGRWRRRSSAMGFEGSREAGTRGYARAGAHRAFEPLLFVSKEGFVGCGDRPDQACGRIRNPDFYRAQAFMRQRRCTARRGTALRRGCRRTGSAAAARMRELGGGAARNVRCATDARRGALRGKAVIKGRI